MICSLGLIAGSSHLTLGPVVAFTCSQLLFIRLRAWILNLSEDACEQQPFLEKQDKMFLALLITLAHLTGTSITAYLLTFTFSIYKALRPDRAKLRKLDQSYYRAEQRRFLVTGAASGLGRHMVTRLSLQGHLVLATDLDEEELAAAGYRSFWDLDERVMIMKLDVQVEEDWWQAIRYCEEHFNGLDVLLNLAHFRATPDIDGFNIAEIVQLESEINFKGICLGTELASLLMTTQFAQGLLPHGGQIVNFSSFNDQSSAVYKACRSGIRVYSMAANEEKSKQGVCVSCVSHYASLPLHGSIERSANQDHIITKQIELAIFSILIEKSPEVIVEVESFRNKLEHLVSSFQYSLASRFMSLNMENRRNVSKEAPLKSSSSSSSQVSRARGAKRRNRRSRSPSGRLHHHSNDD